MPVVEPGKYKSTARIANLLAPRTYEIRVQGTIYNVRNCAGDGVPINLTVERTARINRAYPEEPIRSKLQPYIFWELNRSPRFNDPTHA